MLREKWAKGLIVPGAEGLQQSYLEEISLSDLQNLAEYKEEYKDIMTQCKH